MLIRQRILQILNLAAPLACAVGMLHPPVAAADQSAWKMGGQNLSNTRSQPDEKKISAGNVQRLALRWVVATDGDVSATPAVVDDTLYVPDWAGKLYKIDARSGAIVWKATLPAVSRTTPAVAGNRLIVPLQGLPAGATCAGVAGGACVLPCVQIRSNWLVGVYGASGPEPLPRCFCTGAPRVGL